MLASIPWWGWLLIAIFVVMPIMWWIFLALFGSRFLSAFTTGPAFTTVGNRLIPLPAA